MRTPLLFALALALTALIPWSGELSAATYLVGSALVAPACGWLVGPGPAGRGAVGLARALALWVLWALPLALLAHPPQVSLLSGCAAVAGLMAVGLGLRGSWDAATGARAPWGAIWILAATAAAAGLPLGFGVEGLVWARETPALASRLLDLSPWTLVMESAGFDWMRDARVYESAGTEWYSDTRRPYPVLSDPGSAWSAAGFKSLAAPALVVVGCALSFIAGRLRPAATE